MSFKFLLFYFCDLCLFVLGFVILFPNSFCTALAAFLMDYIRSSVHSIVALLTQYCVCDNITTPKLKYNKIVYLN